MSNARGGALFLLSSCIDVAFGLDRSTMGFDTILEKYMSEHDRLAVFVAEFAAETDRACVVLGGSKVSECLRQLIAATLRPCSSSRDELFDGPGAPLGGFSSRIQVAHRLGVIDDELAQWLNTVRRVRNDFAHGIESASLEHEPHRSRVLQVSKLVMGKSWRLKFFEKFCSTLEIENSGHVAKHFRFLLFVSVSSLEIRIEQQERLAMDPIEWLEQEDPGL